MKIYYNAAHWRNSTLIVLQTHGDMDGLLRESWPYWQASGSDIIVTSPVDDPSEFKGPILGHRISNPPVDHYKLQERAMLVLDQVITEIRSPFYTDCMLLPYDCVFLAPVPKKSQIGLETRLDKSLNCTYISPVNMTPPWWFDWTTLERFMEVAKLHHVDYERGTMDRWIAALCHVHGLPFYQTELIGYARNCIAEGRDVVEASIRAGHPLVHGVKSTEDLEWVLNVATKAGVL